MRGCHGRADPLSPKFPRELYDLPQDKSILPKGAKDQQNASQQPDLKGGHLAGNRDTGSGSTKSNSVVIHHLTENCHTIYY